MNELYQDIVCDLCGFTYSENNTRKGIEMYMEITVCKDCLGEEVEI